MCMQHSLQEQRIVSILHPPLFELYIRLQADNSNNRTRSARQIENRTRVEEDQYFGSPAISQLKKVRLYDGIRM